MIIDRYYVRLRGGGTKPPAPGGGAKYMRDVHNIYQLQNDHERIRYVD